VIKTNPYAVVDTTPAIPLTGRFMRLNSVCEETALPPSSIYAEMSKGEFPKPIKISARRVAWLESEIEAWKAAKLAGRDHAMRTLIERKPVEVRALVAPTDRTAAQRQRHDTARNRKVATAATDCDPNGASGLSGGTRAN